MKTWIKFSLGMLGILIILVGVGFYADTVVAENNSKGLLNCYTLPCLRLKFFLSRDQILDQKAKEAFPELYKQKFEYFQLNGQEYVRMNG